PTPNAGRARFHSLAARCGPGVAMASPIVLIHGAFQTVATWDLVAPRLKAAGRQVIVAPLTGLENDGSDLTETVGLDTHIQDVVSLVGASSCPALRSSATAMPG